MALNEGYGTGSKAIAGGAARIGDRLALQDKETASSQVSSFGATGGRCCQMIENKGRRAGLRLREIKGLGFLDLVLSSQCAGRDLQEAVRGQTRTQSRGQKWTPSVGGSASEPAFRLTIYSGT